MIALQDWMHGAAPAPWTALVPSEGFAPAILGRLCPNPACRAGNVVLPVSGRSAICAACDGAGRFIGVREARERYYRGRNTALTLALQSIGAVDDEDTEGEIWI